MISLWLALNSTPAFAHPAPIITSYACELFVISPTAPADQRAFTFSRPKTADGSHGGAPQIFRSGDHVIAVIADAKWRAIEWRYQDRLVAKNLNAAAEEAGARMANIVYNPADLQEQVHLACDPYPGKFPNQ